MARAPDPRIEQAKAMYQKGRKLIDIAKDLDLPEGTVRRWKSTHKWDGERSDKNSERSVKKKEHIKKGNKLLEDRGPENAELPEKQQLFCVLYAKTLNAAQSYKKAYGCSYETAVAAASRLLTNVKVREEVKRLKKERFEAQLFDEHDVFQRYLDIATSSLTDYVDFGREEVPVMSKMGPATKTDPKTGEKVLVTREVNFVKFRDSSEVDGRMIKKVKMGKDGASIELYDAMKAMEWLADHMSMGTTGQQGLAQSIIAAHRSRELQAEEGDQEEDGDKQEDYEEENG